MVYGIDLGTTNSVIGALGKPISGLVSSRVDMELGVVLDKHSYSKHALSSYKINMGLDEEGAKAIEASTIVLKHLANIVHEKTGDIVKDVIISVPAYFSTNQREAVRIASYNAGMELKYLLNEPTAAAINECKGETGLFLIYDLGGGTFDCTLLSASNDVFYVLGTDGLVLGGDDLDKAIYNYFVKTSNVPVIRQTPEFVAKWKDICRDMKEEMQANAYCVSSSRTYEDYSFILTPSKYKELVVETFGCTITLVNNLLKTRLPENSTYKICFVGGSTYCMYLTEYVSKELGLSMKDVFIADNPNYSVARGVINYADNNQLVELQDITKQISIEMSDGTLYPVIPANSNVPCSGRKLATNTEKTDVLNLKVYQGSSRIPKEENFIGMLYYDYGEIVEKGEGEVEVTIDVDISGLITVKAECLSTFSGLQTITLKL